MDLAGPVILAALGQRTKQSSYWRLDSGRPPQPLLWEDRLNGVYQKAAHADRVLFTRESFREYPNYWVSSLDFKSPRRVTDADLSFLEEYPWGRNILIDYQSSQGKPLQAVLTLPANYAAGRRYPMIVIQYQRLSETLHAFSLPYGYCGVYPAESIDGHIRRAVAITDPQSICAGGSQKRQLTDPSPAVRARFPAQPAW